MPDAGVLAPPAHVWVPEYRYTNGDLAAELAETVSLNGRPMSMDAQQRMILDAIYAEGERPGVPACFEVGVVCTRQNLKTAALQIAALADVFLFDVGLHIWTAHLFRTSTDAFQGMVEMIDSNPDLSRRCRRPRTANGSEAIELLTGQRIEFHARSKGGGRGLTGGKITLDEGLFLAPTEMGALLPTMATVPGAQVRYGSSAGLGMSVMLRAVRDRGRAGGDPSLAYFEWCAQRRPCASRRCDHKVGTDGCALDDRELWWQANPALGVGRITEEFIGKARRAMPPEEFIREFLGWWDEPAETARVINPVDWLARQDRQSVASAPFVLAFDANPERTSGAVGVAGMSGDQVHLEVVDYRPGISWMAPRVAAVAVDLGLDEVLVDGRSPAQSIVPELERLGLSVRSTGPQDMARSCGWFFDHATEGGLVHLGQPELDAALAAAQKRPILGDGFGWDRRDLTDISPLVAVTLAGGGLALQPVTDSRVFVFT